jgi:hypothetical protein
VPYGKIQCVWGSNVFNIVSLWELSHLLKGILHTSQCFKCDDHHLCAEELYLVNGRRTGSLGIKRCMLETGVSSTLFPCEYWLRMWKEYLWSESILRGNHRIMKNTLFRWNGEVHIYYGTIQGIRDRSILLTVSLWELSYLLKGILPIIQGFQMWGTSPLCKIAPFIWKE